jgi:hypothetical protein
VTVWSIEDTEGKEPSSWKLSRFANIGAGEPFVHQIMQELPQLVEAGSITEASLRTRVKEAILLIGIEGLMPALNSLNKIRSLPDPNLPEMDRRQLYDNFGGKLWRAYSELLPSAARALGFDIGFLFKDDAKFEDGLRRFQALYPALRAELGDYLRQQRQHWQTELAHWRNKYLEHYTKSWEEVRSMYDVGHAERFFEGACNAIVIVLAVLIENKLWLGWSLQEVPEERRNPNFPNRFCLSRVSLAGPNETSGA